MTDRVRAPQLAWIIAFFGAIFGAIQTEKFPNFTWFSLIICFFVIVGVFVVIASDAVQTYHVALVGYLSLMLSCSASQSNQFVYSVNGARQASAAGFILLTMISVRLIHPPLFMHPARAPCGAEQRRT